MPDSDRLENDMEMRIKIKKEIPFFPKGAKCILDDETGD